MSPRTSIWWITAATPNADVAAATMKSTVSAVVKPSSDRQRTAGVRLEAFDGGTPGGGVTADADAKGCSGGRAVDAAPSDGVACRSSCPGAYGVGPRTAACQTQQMPPEKLQWKHLYEEVVTSGLCTGCAGCVIACPHDVLGYRDDDGDLPAVPDRRRVRTRRLLARPEGLHQLHPGLSPVPRVGARDRRLPLRPRPRGHGAVGRLQGHRPRPSDRPRPARDRPGRWAGLRHPLLRARDRPHRRGARQLPRG